MNGHCTKDKKGKKIQPGTQKTYMRYPWLELARQEEARRVGKKKAGGASAVWTLVSPWTKGKASNCHFAGCTTVSEGGTAAGLAVCKQSCGVGCNLINFVPSGAVPNGKKRPGRCCRRKCTSLTHLKLVPKWKGWDVYTKSDAPDHAGASATEKTGTSFLSGRNEDGSGLSEKKSNPSSVRGCSAVQVATSKDLPGAKDVGCAVGSHCSLFIIV